MKLLAVVLGPAVCVALAPRSKGRFAALQTRTTMYDHLGLSTVPQPIMQNACRTSFLSINLDNAGSDRELQNTVRLGIMKPCLRIMTNVAWKYRLRKGSHVSICNELQRSVDSAQDEGQMLGSASLAQLFEGAEQARTDHMSWNMFCGDWYDSFVQSLKARAPPHVGHRRMLNQRRHQYYG